MYFVPRNNKPINSVSITYSLLLHRHSNINIPNGNCRMTHHAVIHFQSETFSEHCGPRRPWRSCHYSCHFMLQLVIINSKWGVSVVLRPLCAPLRHDTASSNYATQVCRNTTRQNCVLLLQAPPFFNVPWRWYWFTKYSSLWNIQQTPQLIGLLNANLDFWVGATVQVVYTTYEISKWKLSLPVRSRWNVQGICCIFSDISQSMQKMLVFIKTASSYVKFRFQQRWLWRILSSVTAWPLRTGLTVCAENGGN
jgi:hypothetical protein